MTRLKAKNTANRFALAKAAARKRSVGSGFIEVLAQAQGRSVRAATLKASRPLRVLVVEDQAPPRSRSAVVQALVREGMEVQRTSQPANVVRAIRRFRPDVVVLDDRLKRSGVEFYSLLPDLKQRFPGLRVVVTSEQPEEELSFSTNPLNWGAWDVVHRKTMLQDHKLVDSIVDAVSV